MSAQDGFLVTSKYPATRKANIVDEIHGLSVPDPYRSLEDDRSEETLAWVKAQNQVTHDYLNQLPGRGEIKERLQKLWNYERVGIPFQRAGRWFYTYNSGLLNQPILMTSDSLDGPRTVLLDPNTLSADGTISVSDYRPSEDAQWLAYCVSEAGSDWQTIRVRNIDTGLDREDAVHWVKFSIPSWMKDGSGFFYSRYDKPSGDVFMARNVFHKLYFHRLGTPQAEDRLVYHRPDQPDWGFYGRVTEDGRYLIIRVSIGTDPKNRLFYQDLTDDSPIIELLNEQDASYDFITNQGPIFYLRTDLDAPCFRIIAINIDCPARENWREIVPQKDKTPLEQVTSVGEQLLCRYLQDATTAVACFDLSGRFIRNIPLPGMGTAYGFDGRSKDNTTLFSFSSFTLPPAIYRYSLDIGEPELWHRPPLDLQETAYKTDQVFFTSPDGTKIPMFIIHKKNIALDGTNPALLYGYGGFNISLTPEFSVPKLVWLEMGGVFAMANLRGGGEYGREWRLAGAKLNRQRVFDDFIAAAEWLIGKGYTSPEKLAIQGGSNGGLLVGACLTQRPELYGAALPAVGVLDMLRFEKFTIGWAWKSDYGSVENFDEFKALLAYSPYHNLKPGVRYPATLVTTSDHDDRVVPAHSFKFAARLQECQAADGPPVLIRIEISAGHGAGTALQKLIERTADELAFLVRALKMDLPPI